MNSYVTQLPYRQYIPDPAELKAIGQSQVRALRRIPQHLLVSRTAVP